MTREKFMSRQFHHSEVTEAIWDQVTNAVDGWDHELLGIKVKKIAKKNDKIFGILLTLFPNPDYQNSDSSVPKNLLAKWRFEIDLIGVSDRLGDHVIQDCLRINQSKFIELHKIRERLIQTGLSDAEINDMIERNFYRTPTFEQILYRKRLRAQIEALNKQQKR